MLEFLKDRLLVLHFSYYTSFDLDDVMCNITIYADDTTLYSKCYQAYDMWQHLQLASDLESDLRDIVDWGKKCLVDVNAGKTVLVLFNRSSNTGATNVKWIGLLLR